MHIDCTIIEVDCRERKLRNFCFLYRQQTLKMKVFLHNFEDLLQILEALKHDTILFGDSNIDTIKESKDKSHYENLITASCFKRQNSEPTRASLTSTACLNHLPTNFSVETKKLKEHSSIIRRSLAKYIQTLFLPKRNSRTSSIPKI